MVVTFFFYKGREYPSHQITDTGSKSNGRSLWILRWSRNIAGVKDLYRVCGSIGGLWSSTGWAAGTGETFLLFDEGVD